MKLNRGKLVAGVATLATATLLGVGWVTVVGVNQPNDDDRVGAEQAAAAQVGSIDKDSSGTAASDLGVEQYARGGFAHGGGYGHGYGRAGWGGRGWGGNRWGSWGGGRYVGGRWVGGPYYGWCDDRYRACNRSWW
jgi:hypothetical protein